MDSWPLDERVRTLAVEFTTTVVVVVFVLEELQLTSPRRHARVMADLITVVHEIVGAIKNPTYWTETLYARVMEVEGFEEQVLVDVFDYLQVREAEGRGFMAKKMAFRQAWIEKFLSQME